MYENDENTPTFDVICLREEETDLKNSKEFKIWVPFKEDSQQTTPKKVELITQLLFDQGKVTKPSVDLGERRK